MFVEVWERCMERKESLGVSRVLGGVCAQNVYWFEIGYCLLLLVLPLLLLLVLVPVQVREVRFTPIYYLFAYVFTRRGLKSIKMNESSSIDGSLNSSVDDDMKQPSEIDNSGLSSNDPHDIKKLLADMRRSRSVDGREESIMEKMTNLIDERGYSLPPIDYNRLLMYGFYFVAYLTHNFIF